MTKQNTSKAETPGHLRIRWVRSAIGHPTGVRETIRGLGLHRLRETVERPDTPAIRGMIDKVRHLVEVTIAGAEQ